MRLLFPLFFFAFAGLLADGAVSVTVDQTFPVNPDTSLSLQNINGSVTVETWDRAEIRVVAEKRARTQAGVDAIEVTITAEANHVSVKTDYNREKGSFFGKWTHSGQVEYTLTVPRDAHLRKLNTVNGAIRVSDVGGNVDISSVNGSIRADGLQRDAKIDTVNGHITARFASVNAGQEIDIGTVNGTSEVVLPADANCDIKARTVNGSIRNEFGLEVSKSRGAGRSLKAQLGAGAGTLAISTVNGAIRVNKASGTL